MAEPSNALARALKPSEALVLEYLREHADPDGCAAYARSAIAGALGLAPSTAQAAVAGLRDLGLLEVTVSAGRAPNIYCVQPTDSTDRFEPPQPTDQPTDLTDRSVAQPTDSGSSDARLRERAAATRAPVVVPPTPMVPPTATGVSDPLASASAQPPAPAREAEPTDGNRPIPIGQLAVGAAAEAAKLAGRELEPAVRGRLGRAAQKVAGEHPIEDVLAAARRIGEGAGDDLYTALRAVQRGAPLPATVRAGDADARYADLQRRAEASRQGRDPLWLGRLKPGEIVEAEALYVGTYGERRRFDGELWARELATFPIGAILYGIRAMAKASPHPPTWGEVAAAAGPTLEHERRKRTNRLALQREDERIEARG